MTSLAELDDVDLGSYSGPPRFRRANVPFADIPATAAIGAEATHVTLGLVAMDGNHVIAERPLLLSVRLTIDSVTHLWSDEGALAASVVLDPRSRRLSMSLQFVPHGRSAESSASDAMFLQTLSSATHLALRSPDGRIIVSGLEIPAELRIDEGSVRFLRLLSDVAGLAGVSLTVPAEVGEELVKDLLMARRLLRGEEVRGTWSSATIRLDASGFEAVKNAVGKAGRHTLSTVSTMSVNVRGSEVPLGEVRQILSDAEVKDLRIEGGDVVLDLVAPAGGLGRTVLVPSAVDPVDVTPDIALADYLFDELLTDLDAPARPSRLRELL